MVHFKKLPIWAEIYDGQFVWIQIKVQHIKKNCKSNDGIVRTCNENDTANRQKSPIQIMHKEQYWLYWLIN